MDDTKIKYKLDKLFSLIFTLITLIFSLQCTSSHIIERNVQTSSGSAQLGYNIQNVNTSETNKTDVSKHIKEVENWLKETSKDFDLKPLKEKELSDNEVEIRIWSQLDYAIVTNCLILHKKAKGWEASLVFLRRISNSGEYEKTRKGEIIVNKKAFSAPKSGWDNLNKYLIENGIHTPLSYSWDIQEISPFVESNDEGSVSLEIKEGKKYSLISYGDFTKTKDGRALVGVCRHLEHEFDVELGCGF